VFTVKSLRSMYGRTFSFEPYYERVVSPGERAAWSVTYDF